MLKKEKDSQGNPGKFEVSLEHFAGKYTNVMFNIVF